MSKQNLLQYSFVSLYNKLILVLICTAVSFLHWSLQCQFMLWCLVSLRLMLDLTWLFLFFSSPNASNFISDSITFVLCKKLPVNFTERKKSYWCSVLCPGCPSWNAVVAAIRKFDLEDVWTKLQLSSMDTK